uniref:Uncharacterized protein n=1 Tax=Oryza brachyantha TaxID=4533 RepID=J3LKP0_ORYBR
MESLVRRNALTYIQCAFGTKTRPRIDQSQPTFLPPNSPKCCDSMIQNGSTQAGGPSRSRVMSGRLLRFDDPKWIHTGCRLV